MKILDAKWNPYIVRPSNEFMTITTTEYHYWRITPDLQMDYQQGVMPVEPRFTGQFTCMAYVEPVLDQNSIYAIIGVNDGNVWVVDTETNQWYYSVNILEGPIKRIFSTQSRIVVEGLDDTKIHCWELNKTIQEYSYDASNPEYFFSGKD